RRLDRNRLPIQNFRWRNLLLQTSSCPQNFPTCPGKRNRQWAAEQRQRHSDLKFQACPCRGNSRTHPCPSREGSRPADALTSSPLGRQGGGSALRQHFEGRR